MEVCLETWGDFACYSNPLNKVERLTYPVPPPSAVRGIFAAIYAKPAEFYWQVNRIEVLNPIQYISFKRNEVKAVVSYKPILADEERTQRQTVALKDVRYRFYASICKRPDFQGTEKQLYDQAIRRIRGGKGYYQPSFGLREFVAYYKESDGKWDPISVDMDLGLMVYDVFDLHDYTVTKKSKPKISLFHAIMKQGVIEIPPYDSDEVLKG